MSAVTGQLYPCAHWPRCTCTRTGEVRRVLESCTPVHTSYFVLRKGTSFSWRIQNQKLVHSSHDLTHLFWCLPFTKQWMVDVSHRNRCANDEWDVATADDRVQQLGPIPVTVLSHCLLPSPLIDLPRWPLEVRYHCFPPRNLWRREAEKSPPLAGNTPQRHAGPLAAVPSPEAPRLCTSLTTWLPGLRWRLR